MAYIDYDKLEKYKIEEHDGGLAYSKHILVANTDSENLVKTRKTIKSLYLKRDIKISNDDTLAITTFGRARDDENLYGFFITNINKGLDAEIGIPIDKDKDPNKDYEVLEYAGKYLAKVLKNSGFKNVKVVVDIILDEDECNKYIYACDMLGDERLAVKQIYSSPIEMEKNELTDTDALICFRPKDFSKMIENLDVVKEKIETGGLMAGYYRVKGFVYLNDDIQFYASDKGCEPYYNARFLKECKAKGLYLCVDASMHRRSYDCEGPLISEINRLSKNLDLELMISYGDGAKNLNGTFINKKDWDIVKKEIVSDSVKYKANHDLASNDFFTKSFKDKGKKALTFSDVLIASSPNGMVAINNNINEIHELLKDTKFFVKGFVYANKNMETTSDCGFDLEEDYPYNHKYDITKNTLYFVLGHKEEYMTPYDFIYDFEKLVEHNCIFTVVVNINDYSDICEYENPKNIKFILKENEIKETLNEIVDVKYKEKYKNNYLHEWDMSDITFIQEDTVITSRILENRKYQVISFVTPECEYDTVSIDYAFIDMDKIEIDEYGIAVDMVNDFMFRWYEIKGYCKKEDYNNDLIASRVMSIFVYITLPHMFLAVFDESVLEKTPDVFNNNEYKEVTIETTPEYEYLYDYADVVKKFLTVNADKLV